MAQALSTRILLMTGTAVALALPALSSPAMAQQTTKTVAAVKKTDAQTTLLDKLTISAVMVDQAAINAMAAVSYIDQEELDRIQADTAADLFRTTPGVAASMNGDDPATAINIRGMQQEGRVVVTLDGARQDYWRVGHGSGSFYVEPELLKAATVIRGPSSNGYGSGGIGGVVAFDTKDASDFLRDGEKWAASEKLSYESNGEGVTTSTTAALRFNESADVIGNLVYRNRGAYEDGNGATVPWTGEEVLSGFIKGTFRPAEGHEIKIGTVLQNYDDIVSGSSGSTSATLSRYNADTTNQTYNIGYTFKPLDSDLIDFSANFYHNRTRAEQTQAWPRALIGTMRYYDVATTGFNTRNSSRFTTGVIDHTVTVGGDYYFLEGKSNAEHFGAGEQRGYGAFVQLQSDYADIVQTTVALRYDGYQLDGQTRTPVTDVSVSGDRFSPRVTLGVTPIEGLQVYGTYSEGYRVPGLQDMFRGGGTHAGLANTYRPNLGLRPEVAKSWEAGVNLKYDDLVTDGDSLRAKFNYFNTDVEDYIEVNYVTVAAVGYSQATNIGFAHLQGVEAEAMYDAGFAFVNFGGSLSTAEITSGIYKGQALNNTPLERFSATLGVRLLDEQLTLGAQYLSVGEVTRTRRTASTINAADTVDEGFNLVNVFANYQVNENVRLDLGVDNVFDTSYTDPQSAWSTTSATEQGRGRTFKISLTGRIGG